MLFCYFLTIFLWRRYTKSKWYKVSLCTLSPLWLVENRWCKNLHLIYALKCCSPKGKKNSWWSNRRTTIYRRFLFLKQKKLKKKKKKEKKCYEWNPGFIFFSRTKWKQYSINLLKIFVIFLSFIMQTRVIINKFEYLIR